jgi:alpha-ketoglutarate-dependent taurine dioxygenase
VSIDQRSRVRFERMKPLVGSRVVVERREDLFDPAVVGQIRRELDERTAIVIPQVDLSHDEQLAFTDLLGQRQNLTGNSTTDPNDDVYKVTLDKKINRAPEYVLGTFFFHIDGMPTPTPPPYATLLSCHRKSAVGGETEFANTDAAWEALPDEEKAQLEHLRVIHSVASSLRDIADTIPERHKGRLGIGIQAERPLVYTRKSGRKSLLIGTTADTIVGMEVAHGRAVIRRLNEWAAQPQFCYRHRWEEGDLAIWVNPAALHRAMPYDAESGRMMHRTSVGAEVF